MSDSETSSSDMAGMSFETYCSSSSRSTDVFDCPYAVASGERCPLYSAVLQYSNLELLEINRDAKDEPTWLHSNDPILLHSAVEDDNLDAVCAMLYYGANLAGDPNELSFQPVESDFSHGSIEIAKVLINFYDDRFLMKKCPVGGYSYNTLMNLLSVYVQNDAMLFKLLFLRIDPNDVDQLHYLFAAMMEYECNELATEEWLECAYLILKNINKASPHLYNNPKLNTFSSLYSHLFLRFFDKNVQQEDRLRITYICLSLGITPDINDCEVCYDLYGFGDELETLIYNVYSLYSPRLLDEIVLLALPAISNLTQNIFSNILRDRLSYFHPSRWNRFLEFLGFYSLSLQQKEEVKRECTLNGSREIIKVFQRVNEVPEFPTLFELSRNQVREIIAKLGVSAYQFHDVVKQLDLPDCIKDKIRLKTPLY